MNETVTNVVDEEVVKDTDKAREELLEKLEKEMDAELSAIFAYLNIEQKIKEALPEIEKKIKQHLDQFAIGLDAGNKKSIKREIRFFETLEELNIIKHELSSMLRIISSCKKGGKSKKTRKFVVPLKFKKGLSEEEYKQEATRQLQYHLKGNNAPSQVIGNTDAMVEKLWQEYKADMEKEGIGNNE